MDDNAGLELTSENVDTVLDEIRWVGVGWGAVRGGGSEDAAVLGCGVRGAVRLAGWQRSPALARRC